MFTVHSPEKFPWVRYLPTNTQGRDFVIGDLHGEVDLLQEVLDQADFDPAVDRLFSTGDLIDRGPQSLQALRLRIHAVMGNHDLMLLWHTYNQHLDYQKQRHTNSIPYRVYTDRVNRIITGANHNNRDATLNIRTSTWMANGGDWFFDQAAPHLPNIPDVVRRRLQIDLRRLWRQPLILVVGEGENRFNVVHGDFKGSNADIDRINQEGMSSDHFNQVLFSRYLIDVIQGFVHDPMRPENQQKILDAYPTPESWTFSGHTIVGEEPLIVPGKRRIYMDTGASIDSAAKRHAKCAEDELYGYLSMMEVNTKKVYAARNLR